MTDQFGTRTPPHSEGSADPGQPTAPSQRAARGSRGASTGVEAPGPLVSAPLEVSAAFPRLHLTEPEPATCDDIADLFLGDAGAARFGPPESARRRSESDPCGRRSAESIRREAVVLGHLPVLPAAWLSVYARTRAAATGRPVAVLHRRTQSVEWDLCPPPSSSRLVVEPSADLEAAIADLAEHRADWLIRVPELDEPDLAGLGSLTDLTILTTTGEHALVATYRVLKTFAAAWETDAGAVRMPRLRVAFFLPEGAAHGPAKDAAERLTATARSFLDVTPEYELIAAKIRPSRRTPVYSGPFEAPISEILEAIVSAESAAGGVIPHRQVEMETTIGVETAAAIARELREVTTSALLGRAGPEPSANGAEDAARGAAGDERSHDPDRACERDPERDVNREPRHGTDPSTGWAERLDGLAPLRARCPYARDVELATDASGRLHLIADAEERPGRRTPTPADAAAQLMNAASWAHDHRELLAMSESDLMDPGGTRGGESLGTETPRLHLVVSSAPEARPLLDTGMRLYLAVDGRLLPLNNG